MIWLGKHIELDTESTIWAIVVFSILSIICSIFTIVIYLRMKNLRTVVYRFFFHAAINEIISRILILIIVIAKYKKEEFTFLLFSSLIYLTDTNIIILTTFTCLSMFLLIIKQNNKLTEQFNKISFVLYGTSFVFSLIFFLISFYIIDEGKDEKDNLYRNIIALNFITDDKDKHLYSVLFNQIIYLLLLILSFVCIFLIQAFVKDRANIPSNMENEEEAMKDKTIKSSLKLKTFKIKLLAYPLMNLLYIIPLTLYLWIEYNYLSFKEKEEDLDKDPAKKDREYDARKDMDILRIRYTFYNIYCFMSSIRGYIYFRVFIDNETIKMYLFKKYLHGNLFKTMDKIQEEELSNEKSSKIIERDNITPIKKEINNNYYTNFDIDNKNKNNLINSEDKNISERNKRDSALIEMDSKSKQSLVKTGLINDEEDDSDDSDENDEAKKLSKNKNN